MRNRILGLFGLFVLAGSALAQVTLTEGVPPPSFQAVAQGNNAFACDLYARLSKSKGNLFFSPYSISSALAMTYAGAKGQTTQEMATTLHLDLPADHLHAGFAELQQRLTTVPGAPCRLSVANALWGQKGLTFLPAFLKVTTEQHKAGLSLLDFAQQSETSRQTINAWVEKQTGGKIKDLLQPGDLSADTRLVLTNAIYFQAEWAHKFPVGETQSEDFTLATGATVQVPMMAKDEELAYGEGDGFQIVALPYQDSTLSLVVVLPTKCDGLPVLEKALTAAKLNEWLKTLAPHQVDLKLPRFKTTTRFELSQVLAALGMPTAFTDDADFSGMSTQEKLHLSKVIHQAFVDIQEKGTEAAAATAVATSRGIATRFASDPLPAAVFHAERPFLFLIRDNATGSIVFLGRVMNPQG
jgi:serpin B